MDSTVLLAVKNHAPWARDVAESVTNVERAGTEVVVLHVFDECEERATRVALDENDTLSMNELAGRMNGVDAAVTVLANSGLNATPDGVRVDGRTADTILKVAKTVDADRIYLYGRKRSPAGKAVFGSTVQQVILNASVPVTIVPAEKDHKRR